MQLEKTIRDLATGEEPIYHFHKKQKVGNCGVSNPKKSMEEAIACLIALERSPNKILKREDILAVLSELDQAENNNETTLFKKISKSFRTQSLAEFQKLKDAITEGSDPGCVKIINHFAKLCELKIKDKQKQKTNFVFNKEEELKEEDYLSLIAKANLLNDSIIKKDAISVQALFEMFDFKKSIELSPNDMAHPDNEVNDNKPNVSHPNEAKFDSNVNSVSPSRSRCSLFSKHDTSTDNSNDNNANNPKSTPKKGSGIPPF